MKRFIEGEERSQITLLPECLDDYIAEENPVRVVDVFVDELKLHELGFDGVEPAATGRPSYHPAVLLKIYIYGYLNQVQSSRRLEREAQRNVELMWLTGRLAPDFKTVADFRKDHGDAIRKVCREFVLLCRRLKLFADGIVAIDGSKFKAVNNRDKNFSARLKQPGNLDAWDTCQRGLWHLQRFTRQDFAAAEPLFLRATQLDPNLAQPNTALALLRGKEAAFLWTAKPAEALGESMMSARAALAADGLDPAAHSQLGIALAFTGKYDDALAMGQKGVELNPSNAFGYWGLGLTYMLRGEPEQGIRAMETAIRISPNDVLLPLWLTTLSTLHYLARSYERSAEVARLVVQRAPPYPLGWRSLANALGQLGTLDEAREALAQFLTLMPSYTTEQAARASVRFRDEPVFQHYLEGLRKAGWKG